jgi:hypothetical protein
MAFTVYPTPPNKEASRVFGTAPATLNGVCAGSIDSRNGSATVTPAPRNNVRRERCFFVMKFMTTSPIGGLLPHLEWFALDHAKHKR